MTTAIDNRQSTIGNDRAPSSRVPEPRVQNPLRGLWAEFRKLPAAMRTDAARYAWSSDQLRRPVTTWKTLTAGEIKRLTRAAKEESGSGPGYRAVLIAKLACEFWGPQNWDGCLREDLQRRWHTPYPQSLAPSEARATIEELVSRIARRDGVSLEKVRTRFSPQRRGGAEKQAADHTDLADRAVAPVSPPAHAGEDTRATTAEAAL